jgi:DNA-binding NtrC family response regulator
MMGRIVLIDDDPNLREVVSFILDAAGHEVASAGGGADGLALCRRRLPDLVITDIRMPEMDGMEVLRRLRGVDGKATGQEAADRLREVPVIVLTAHGSVEQAVEAMKLGAFTYLQKPFEREELLLTVEQALRTGALARDNRTLRRLLRERSGAPRLVARSAVMRTLLDQLERVAPSDVTVLITGESGTGKELVARACHDLSRRWDRPFVTVNCGALPRELVEATLFGHERGAFTGADRPRPGRIRAADGGTLFLDEIAELPLELQPKLLRALETRQIDPVGGAEPVAVDFRLVCATNRDLQTAAAAGEFRDDLYYRLAVLPLHLPPLRQRRQDIAPLWEQFTRQHAGSSVKTDPQLLQLLEQRDWPGNVRELRNLNERLLLLRSGDTLTIADLERAERLGRTGARPAPGVSVPPAPPSPPPAGGSPLPLMQLPEGGFSLTELEKEVIRRALARHGGNKSRTAAYLGIPRHILVYRIEKYGL